MKLFPDNCFINSNKIAVLLLLGVFVFQSCATHEAQFGKNNKNPLPQNANDTTKIAHTFYLIGDAGNAEEEKAQQTLALLEGQLKKASENSTLLFLGDNI